MRCPEINQASQKIPTKIIPQRKKYLRIFNIKVSVMLTIPWLVYSNYRPLNFYFPDV